MMPGRSQRPQTFRWQHCHLHEPELYPEAHLPNEVLALEPGFRG